MKSEENDCKKVISEQIESIREKIAGIKLPIENCSKDENFNTEKREQEVFDFPKDLDPSEVKVTKVCIIIISELIFVGQNPAGDTIWCGRRGQRQKTTRCCQMHIY